MNANRNWCLDDVNTVVRLHRTGIRIDDIASRFGRSHGSISKILNANGIKRPRGTASSEYPAADGPAIGPTAYDLHVREDAIVGSMKLLSAIQRAGVRP